MTVTPEGVGAAVAVLTLAGAGVGAYLGVIINRLDEKIADEKEAREEDKRQASERFMGLHDEAKEARKDMERRLAEIEKTYLTRAELTEAMRALTENYNRGIDRIEQVVGALGRKVDHLAGRVVKVEADT